MNVCIYCGIECSKKSTVGGYVVAYDMNGSKRWKYVYTKVNRCSSEDCRVKSDERDKKIFGDMDLFTGSFFK